jgi:hypothetical protein
MPRLQNIIGTDVGRKIKRYQLIITVVVALAMIAIGTTAEKRSSGSIVGIFAVLGLLQLAVCGIWSLVLLVRWLIRTVVR